MSINDGGGPDFERLLEQELQNAAGRLQGPSPLARQSAYRTALATGGLVLSPFSIGALLSSKLVVAAAASTLVVGGAVTATAATGSANPGDWGAAVVQAVQGCKTTVGTGPDAANHTASGARDNVGQCVSAFAKTHGQEQRALHASPSPGATTHPTGKPTDKGKPAGTPGGPPSGVPPGPPSTLPTPSHGRPYGVGIVGSTCRARAKAARAAASSPRLKYSWPSST